ncbi:MAG TPA: dihydrodipicolinate synthase family protein [Acidobacteriaceae bacterium]|jgi:dihydrodipicolinate synthase/N-acetylneuraminate lyase|nr:dihydrodipicolinate synthase family protein [Acidobacteriaceae bacterium]
MLIEGIFPAITTPFYPDGTLYLRKLEHNVDRYARTQLAGMVVLGSTGEPVMLSMEEQGEVLKTAIEAASDEKVMLAGVGQESVLQTLRLAETAAKLNYDAVLVRTPHFYRGQLHRTNRAPAEMLTYYRTVADQSALPVLLYSVPVLTQYELPAEVVAELAQHPNIIGIKDSSGKSERIAALAEATKFRRRTVTVTPVFAAVTARMQTAHESGTGSQNFVAAEALGQTGTALAAAPPKAAMKTRQKEVGFAVLAGAPYTLQASLDAGASGGVLAFASCAPQCCYEVYAAWKEGDMPLAAEKQLRVQEASLRVGAKMGIPGIKYACDLNGYYGGRSRLPLLPLTSEEEREVATLMADVRY